MLGVQGGEEPKGVHGPGSAADLSDGNGIVQVMSEFSSS